MIRSLEKVKEFLIKTRLTKSCGSKKIERYSQMTSEGRQFFCPKYITSAALLITQCASCRNLGRPNSRSRIYFIHTL